MNRVDRRELPGMALIAVLSVLRAVGLVLIAESLAGSIAALASGASEWRDALVLGAIGAVLRAGSTWAVSTVASRLAAATKSRIRRELVERVAAGGVDGGSTAVLATSGLDDLDEYYGAVIPAAISAVVVPLVLGARILSVDWLSAVIIAVTVPLIPLFMILIGMHTRDRADAAASSLARLSDHLVELARGLPVLVGLGRVDEQTAALDGVQREWRDRTSRMLRTAFLSALALELIATLSVAVVAVVLGLRLLSGGIGLEVALLVLLLAPDCFAALREVGAAFHSAQDGRAALRRARELVDAAPARTLRALPWRVGEGIRLRGLTVRYPGRPQAVLSDFSLDLPPDTVTAVTAPSGRGKSTLLAVLAGNADRDIEMSGEVVGLDPTRIAYVAQAPAFFGETVGQEVALWSGEEGHGAVLRALGLAGMDRRRISELSPGEQRRLAVARAAERVEAGATLALLDEPTAHLDPENAAEVREVIRRMRRRAAVLLVSHDEATIGIANRVVELPGPVAGAPAAREVVVETAAPRGERRAEAEAAGAPEGELPTGVLRALLRPARGRWASAILLGVASTCFGLALTAVSAWLIVRAAEHPAIMYLSVAIVGVRFFGLGRSVARYAERLITHAALFAATDVLRLRVWRSIAARGAGSRRLLEGGSAIDYLVTTIDQLRDLVPRVVSPAIVGVLSVLGVIVAVALVAPGAAALVAAVLVVTAVGVPLLVARVARSAQAHRVEVRSLLVRRLVALADAAPELRANGLAPRAIVQVVDADADLAADDRRAARSAGLGAALLFVATAGLAVLVPVLAGAGLLGARVPAETTAVVALLALAAVDPLGELLRASERVPALRAVLARLRPFTDDPVSIALPSVDALSVDPRPDLSTPALGLGAPIRRVELDGVAARWPGAAHPVFRDVSAAAASGEWLIVDGPSGAGKSTLLSILLGSLPANEGAVLIDGMPLAAIPPSAWRRRVAWCPQDAHVFESTIRGNLLLGRPRTDPVSDAEMRDMLDRVGLGDPLARLPDGLDTRVGAAGGTLSGGERQRLAVARALLGRSELLLLDEPTAHLDAGTAAALMADLRAATRDRIVVLVTHRSEDRRPTDRVVHLGRDDYAESFAYEKSPA